MEQAAQDWVRVRGLKVFAPVGVYPHEMGIEQELWFDVDLCADLCVAGRSDDLDDALDYDRVSAICRQTAKKRHHRLIESIAEEVAMEILSAQPRVQEVRVSVKKPQAVPDADWVGVEIRRTRRPD